MARHVRLGRNMIVGVGHRIVDRRGVARELLCGGLARCLVALHNGPCLRPPKRSVVPAGLARRRVSTAPRDRKRRAVKPSRSCHLAHFVRCSRTPPMIDVGSGPVSIRHSCGVCTLHRGATNLIPRISAGRQQLCYPYMTSRSWRSPSLRAFGDYRVRGVMCRHGGLNRAAGRGLDSRSEVHRATTPQSAHPRGRGSHVDGPTVGMSSRIRLSATAHRRCGSAWPSSSDAKQ